MADNEPAPEKKPVRYIRSREFRNVYTNSFRMRATANDVGVNFGYQSELPNDETVLQDEVEIIMTPLTVKFLTLVLQSIVDDIEKQAGQKIEIPAEMLEQFKERQKTP
jgi:hypothetical protein